MANDNDIIARLKVEGLNQFKAELAQSSKSADGTTTAVQRMEKAIADATDPKDVQRLTKELEAVKVATEASQTAFESSKAKLRAYKEEATGLATILATMKSEGKQNTQTFKDIEKQFEATKKKAGELSDQINDINQEIKSLGSDTRGIDNVVRGATLMANSFQLATGVQALFGKENKALTEGLLKLNGIMAVTQSIQEIGNELTREDSIVKQAASKATALYALVVGESTGALKFFRLALAATGIGLLIIGVTTLIANFDKLTESGGLLGRTLSTIGSIIDKSIQKYKDLSDAIGLTTFAEKEAAELQKQIEKERLKQMERDADTRISILKIQGKNTLDLELKRLKDQQKLADEARRQAHINGDKDEEQLNDNYKDITEKIKIKEAEIVQFKIDFAKAEAKRIADAQRKALEEENKRIGVPAPKINIQNAEASIKSAIKTALENVQRTQQDFELEFTIDQNSPSLEPLRAAYNDALRRYEIIKAQFENKLKPAALDILGNIPELPTDPNAEGDFKRGRLTLFERIFGTVEENYDAQKRTENFAKGSLKIIGELNQYGQQISSIAEQAIQIRSANELQLLEDKKNRGLITEKEYEKQSAQIKNEAAQKKRKIDIANATAQIPVAVLSAYIAGLQIGGPAAPIVAGILAGVAGAFGLAQVALIASAPLPKFRDGGSVRKRLGLIKGKKHEQGGVPIEVEGDEFVMKSQATKKYGVKMLEDINNLRYNPIITANGKLSNKNKQDTRIYENLAIIGSYLKQGYKVDAQGNQILKEISDKLNNKSVYV